MVYAHFYLSPSMCQTGYPDLKQKKGSVRTIFSLQNAEVFQLILMGYILQPKPQQCLDFLAYIYDLQVRRSPTSLLIRQTTSY